MSKMYYGFKFPDGRLAGIDEKSTGQPYPVETIVGAHLREANDESLFDMKIYQKVYNEHKLELVLLQVKMMPVKHS